MRLPWNRNKNIITETPTDPNGISYAFAVGGELILNPFETGTRSNIEREVNALRRGASGVSDTGLASIMRASVPIYACVNKFATSAREIPITVSARMQDVSTYHPFQHFIHKQSPSIIEDSTRSLLVWGKVFLRKRFNASGYPVGLEFIHPMNIQQKTDRDGVIVGYKMLRPSEDELIPPDEIIYIALFDYGGDGDPLSPVENAYLHAGVEQGIANHAISFFFNRALPVGVVTFDPPMINKKQFDLAKKKWKREFQGASSSHKTALLNHKIIWTPLQDPPKDLAMPELNDNSKQMVCSAIGVPPALVGLGDATDPLSAQNTLQATRLAWIADTVVPFVEHITQGITEQWAARDWSPPNFYKIEPDRLGVPGLSAVTSDNVTMGEILLTSGVWDYDEFRSFLRLPQRQETEDRKYVKQPTQQSLDVLNGSLASLNQARALVGLEPEPFDFYIIEGRAIPYMRVGEYIEGSVEAPIEEAVLPVSDEPLVALPELVEPLALEAPPNLSIRAETDISLRVSFAHHNLVKMAKRQLAGLLKDEQGITWVDPESWWLDVCNLSGLDEFDKITDLIGRFKIGTTEPMTINTDGYYAQDGTVYLLIQDDDRRGLFDHMRSTLEKQFDLQTERAEQPGIPLARADVSSVDVISDLPDIPLVVDTVTLVIGNQALHTWKLAAVTEAQRKELRQWQERVSRAWKRNQHIPDFEVLELPEHVAHFVRDGLLGDGPEIKEVFRAAWKLLEQRAIQATRLEFEELMEGFIREAIGGNLARRRFISLVKAEIRRWGQLAFRDGLIDGGVLDGVPDENDQQVIKDLLKEAQSHVSRLADQVYDDEAQASMAETKPALWYRGSIAPLYQAGLLSADKNGMYEFAGLPGADSCRDCQRLEGQRHRLKAWAERDLLVPRVGQNTECEGWQCNHILVPTDGRARGRF
jgi:HK97 family phage portal protein